MRYSVTDSVGVLLGFRGFAIEVPPGLGIERFRMNSGC